MADHRCRQSTHSSCLLWILLLVACIALLSEAWSQDTPFMGDLLPWAVSVLSQGWALQLARPVRWFLVNGRLWQLCYITLLPTFFSP